MLPGVGNARFAIMKGEFRALAHRFVGFRKKRQRQHAADKVLALGAFGNETFIAIYGSLVFITLIIAVFNDLQLF